MPARSQHVLRGLFNLKMIMTICHVAPLCVWKLVHRTVHTASVVPARLPMDPMVGPRCFLSKMIEAAFHAAPLCVWKLVHRATFVKSFSLPVQPMICPAIVPARPAIVTVFGCFVSKMVTAAFRVKGPQKTARRVHFQTAGVSIHEVPCYSEHYRYHPRCFNFGPGGELELSGVFGQRPRGKRDVGRFDEYKNLDEVVGRDCAKLMLKLLKSGQGVPEDIWALFKNRKEGWQKVTKRCE